MANFDPCLPPGEARGSCQQEESWQGHSRVLELEHSKHRPYQPLQTKHCPCGHEQSNAET